MVIIMHIKSHKLRDIEEEILEALFDLHTELGDNSFHKMKIILERLPRVSKTQLTNIVQRKLEKLGYVDYTRYDGVRLTPEGLKLAQKIARNHRLAEAILYQFFKMPFTDIHEQACLLEHAISDKMAQAIYTSLPEKKTPFGISIPMDTIEDMSYSNQTILDTKEGSIVILTRVSVHSYKTAETLDKHGIKGIGTKITVQKIKQNEIVISANKITSTIPIELARTLFVDPSGTKS